MKAIDRRTFLQTSALGMGAGFLPGHSGGAATDTCGLGMGTYGLQSLGLAEAISLIARVGFECVEIAVFPGFTGDPAALDAEARKTLSKQLNDTKLRLSALMADLHPSADDANHRKQTETFQRLCDLGRDLSPGQVPLVQTVLGGKQWEESKNLFRDRLADWMQVAADQKVVLAIKPHRGNAMSQPANALWLFRQLGESPWIRMVYDYSHFHFREPAMTVAGTVLESLPWTAYVASKDAIQRDGKVVFALPGEGDGSTHAEIIQAFHAGGYRGDFCCEVSSQIWKSPGYDPVAATEICHRNMAAAFLQAVVARG